MVIPETSNFPLVHTANPCFSGLCHSAEQCSVMGQVTRYPADHEHSWSYVSKPLSRMPAVHKPTPERHTAV